MPKPPKSDTKLIVETYKELQNESAVARKLGLHLNTIHKHLMNHQGLCFCGRSIATDRSIAMCSICLDRYAALRRKRVQKRRAAGLCSFCNNSIDDLTRSAWLCTECLDKTSAAQRERYRKDPQRLQEMTRKYRDQKEYGGNRVKVLERDEYTCVVCDDNTMSPRQTTVHHIDGDRENNCLNNLDTICSTDHIVLTIITNHSDPIKLLNYIKRHYGFSAD